MPTIDVALWDLERLVGASERELLKGLEHMKGEIEERSGDRLRIEVTHDRPDHFSAEGLARSLKGILGIEEGLPKAVAELGNFEVRYEGRIDERPYAIMAIVRDLSLDEEAIAQMIQLQEKIHDTYGRNRRKIAIGFYDLSKIRPPIYYKRISQEDEYVPLGFDKPIKIKEMYEMTEKGRKFADLIRRERPPALVDSEGKIMVVIPILGSECCKVTPSTRDVLIDVTSPQLDAPLRILPILIYNLLERSKSKKVELVKINGSYVTRLEPRRIRADRQSVNELLGLNLDEKEYLSLLRKARHDVEEDWVLVAPYRINVISWVDVAEDIAIMRGYNDMPREPPPVLTLGRRHKVEVASEDVRKSLLSLGFQEIMNGVLIHSALLDDFKLAYPILANPVSERLNAVRSSMLPGLLYAVAALRRPKTKLFEIGDVVVNGRTLRAVAIAMGGEGLTITDGIMAVNSLCEHLGVRCKAVNGNASWCIEGRCAKIEGPLSGYVGEVSPELLVKYDIFMPVVLGELIIG